MATLDGEAGEGFPGKELLEVSGRCLLGPEICVFSPGLDFESTQEFNFAFPHQFTH